MAICDVCNEEASYETGTCYTAREFRLLVSQGFMPEDGAARAGVQLVAKLSGVSERQAYAMVVEEAGTDGWLLCPRCAARAGKLLPNPAGTGAGRDKSTAPPVQTPPAQPAPPAQPGPRRLPTAAYSSSESMLVCDVCKEEASVGSGTVYTPRELFRLTSKGFKPVGVGRADLMALAKTHRISEREAIDYWRGQIGLSTDDWFLCPTCAARAEDIKAKRWWQFWKVGS